jgi:spore maturation protein CgeB
MKFLIVDSYYPRFLASAMPHVLEGGGDYSTLLERVLQLRFGTADFYSRNLRALGHDADDIIFNCDHLQQQWARENGSFSLPTGLRLPNRLARFSLLRRFFGEIKGSMLDIALQQIRRARPDVLYLQDLNLFSSEVLQQLRAEGSIGIAVGQIACPLPEWKFLDGLDLILTSFPHYVPRFRDRGISSEYFRIGFEPAVLDEIGGVARDHACTFVGGISPAHEGRLHLLEHLARNVDMTFYGYGIDSLDRSSPIVPRHRGEAWSLDMYKALARSRITVNVHIDAAENNANNMRLYEATGCGALLVTDAKNNLAELFESEHEVVTYRDAGEAVEKIRYYLDHPDEAEVIARAGQARTLREHTYGNRMAELVSIVSPYLAKRNLPK